MSTSIFESILASVRLANGEVDDRSSAWEWSCLGTSRENVETQRRSNGVTLLSSKEVTACGSSII